MAFVHLHNHTIYSLLDGMNQLKPMIAKAKADGQTAIAITDHGACYGLPFFYAECKKQGIKPILGCEVYEAPESRFLKEAKKKKSENEISEKPYHHLVLLVKNEEGYKNLCKLVTKSNTEGFYYKPRIDRELLEQYHEGLVCLSACLAGRIPYDILHNPEKAEEDILWYKNLFGEDFYLEIQNHGIREEAIVSQELVKYSRKLDVKLVCTNDCHYLDSKDDTAHDWLMCIQTGKTVNDPNRMTYEGDYSVKTEEEMRELFPSLPEAFDNTVEIADKCSFDFEYGKYRMPEVKIPEEFGKDYFGYLEHLAWEGYEKRYPEGHKYRDEARTRLTYELSVIKQMNFAEYFLDTRMTVVWAKDNGILVGVGRGSGAGSVMNYCLNITDIEPLRYGLLFERFLNPERISMPDIDVDYDYAFKDDVVRFEAERNGLDRFCKIQTLGTMKAKSIIKDCAKVAGYEPIVGNTLAKMISPKAENLTDAYGLNPDIEAYLNTDRRIRELWKQAVKLEGCKKSAGTHACGHIPTPIPCEELFPCRVDEESGYLVCEYDMTEAEHLGNLKKDLLMLRNLTIINVAKKAVLDHYGKDVSLWSDDILYDMDALKLFWTGDTLGIFQFESEGMKNFMKQLKPDTFEDIIAGVALYRPGPMDYIPDYVQGKQSPESVKYLTPELEPILKTTYGVIVYQEQVMQICTNLAGFTMGRADVVRKAMGKKKKDIMDAEKPHFIYGDEELGIKGCVGNGISEEVAIEIWSRMEKFAEYAFNKSHAACYACISMETAYLKKHYPVEFMAGLLTSVMDKPDKFVPYYLGTRDMGIKVLSPNVNTSFAGFTSTKDNTITFGLASISGISESAVEAIVKAREERPFSSFKDFRTRTGMKKNQLMSLIKAGALDDFGNRASLLAEAEKSVKKKKQEMEGQMTLFLPEEDLVKLEDLPELDKPVLLKYEKESMGIYLSGHPVAEIKRKKSETPISEIIDEVDEEGVPTETPYHEGMNVSLLAVFSDVTKRYTKKDGKPMASVTIEDETGTIRGVVFPKQYERLKDSLEENIPCTISGNLSEDGESLQLIVDSVSPAGERNFVNKKYFIRAMTEEQKIEICHTLKNGKDNTSLFYNGMYKRKGSNISEVIDRIKEIAGEDNVKMVIDEDDYER